MNKIDKPLGRLVKKKCEKTHINKIYTQKSSAFLYTNNKKSKREIKKIFPIHHCNKKNKTPMKKIYLKRRKTSMHKTIRH